MTPVCVWIAPSPLIFYLYPFPQKVVLQSHFGHLQQCIKTHLFLLDNMKRDRKKEMQKRRSTENKTGLQPVCGTVELVHYLKGWGLVQSPFDVKAVQTVTLLAVLICKVYITITNFH